MEFQVDSRLLWADGHALEDSEGRKWDTGRKFDLYPSGSAYLIVNKLGSGSGIIKMCSLVGSVSLCSWVLRPSSYLPGSRTFVALQISYSTLRSSSTFLAWMLPSFLP